MTEMNIVIASILIFASISVITSVQIVGELQKHGIKANAFYLRFMLFSYLAKYREMTLKENGCVGRLYYTYIISINAALITAIYGIATGSFHH